MSEPSGSTPEQAPAPRKGVHLPSLIPSRSKSQSDVSSLSCMVVSLMEAVGIRFPHHSAGCSRSRGSAHESTVGKSLLPGVIEMPLRVRALCTVLMYCFSKDAKLRVLKTVPAKVKRRPRMFNSVRLIPLCEQTCQEEQSPCFSACHSRWPVPVARYSLTC